MSALGRAGRLTMLRRIPRLPIGRSALLVVLAVFLLLGGAYLWLRDSSLVAVHSVRITGNVGPDQAQIARALRGSARGMTTLNVDQDGLRTAVAPYPVVKDVQVRTRFPHGLEIHLIEQIPVAAVVAAGHATAVAGDGTLLHDVPTGGLPAIPVRVPPGGTRVSDTGARQAVSVLSGAPYAMLAHLTQVTEQRGHGVVAQLRGGPEIVFGSPDQLAAKWSAAAAVLADPGSAGAGYIDVSDPARPAAGAALSTGSTSTGG